MTGSEMDCRTFVCDIIMDTAAEEFRVGDTQAKGDQAAKLGDFGRAAQMYTYGLYVCPESASLLLSRAAVYMHTHSYNRAWEDAAAACELLPASESSYRAAADALRELDRLKEALAVTERGIACGCSQLVSLAGSLQRELEESLSPYDSIRIEALLSWLLGAGATYQKLKMRSYRQDDRGVHSASYICSGEELISVPLSHIITLNVAQQSTTGKRIVESLARLESPRHCVMASFLLEEKRNASSFWKPYLDILPQSFTTFPLFYTENEIRLLSNSSFAVILQEKRESIAADYREICEFVPEFREFSLLDFQQARLVVSSRVFGIVVDERKTDALVPLADMLNHQRPPSTTWTYDSATSRFRLFSVSDIPRTAVVSDSYGRKSNSELLLNYGFLCEENSVEDCFITLRWSECDPLLPRKQEIADGCGQLRVRLEAGMDGTWRELVGILRLMECDDESLLVCAETERRKTRTGAFTPSSITPLSTRCEIQTMERLKSLCESHLGQYPTSIEIDLQRNLPTNHRNILVLLMGEKRVLQWYRDFSVHSLRFLHTGEVLSDSYSSYLAQLHSFLPVSSV